MNVMIDILAVQARQHIEPLIDEYQDDIYNRYLLLFHPIIRSAERARINNAKLLFQFHILVSTLVFMLLHIVGCVVFYFIILHLNEMFRNVIDPFLDPIIDEIVISYELMWIQDNVLNILFISSLAPTFWPALQWIYPSPIWPHVLKLVRAVLYLSWMRMLILNIPIFLSLYVARPFIMWTINLFPLIDTIIIRFFPNR